MTVIGYTRGGQAVGTGPGTLMSRVVPAPGELVMLRTPPKRSARSFILANPLNMAAAKSRRINQMKVVTAFG